MKNYAHKGKNNPNSTDRAMALELTTVLKNTALDGKFFRDNTTLNTRMHPKAKWTQES